ncbi:WXG100 family type VII secretion target [Streptomyces sp. JJ66]|uniref:WXG100 family type VII secretion target n=1 Tax=Streptomyces sp. JJ66 TaxID=2803843 RepID=UPI001C5953CF|nr:WXG100 family type VII secretion target [Streptomyces sp. JJ66]MBW1601204.1 WXG100 family type VII secretion target [Streptomyces sp. JJ66]
MTNIEVSYGTVIKASEDIGKAATDIATDLENLHSKVMKVVATWEGEAQQAFHAKQTGWEQNVEDLKNTLQDISKALLGATDGYSGTDLKAAQRFQS